MAQDDLDAAFAAHATLTRQRSPVNGDGPSGHLAITELRVGEAVKEVVRYDPSVRALLPAGTS